MQFLDLECLNGPRPVFERGSSGTKRGSAWGRVGCAPPTKRGRKSALQSVRTPDAGRTLQSGNPPSRWGSESGSRIFRHIWHEFHDAGTEGRPSSLAIELPPATSPRVQVIAEPGHYTRLTLAGARRWPAGKSARATDTVTMPPHRWPPKAMIPASRHKTRIGAS